MSNLLLDEQPLVVLPKLASLIGLNEAIALQQLHYWVERSKNEKEGTYWVYNTVEEWREQFPFWSKNTVIRTFEKLEKKELVSTGCFNRNKSDRTKWYTINYDQLTKLSSPSTQDEQMDNPKWVNGSSTQDGQLVNQRIPQTTSETTTEDNIPFVQIVSYLNVQAKTSYRPATKKTKQLIAARWKEGFTLEDFKRVVDNKVAEWLNDSKMNQYLRPETLFGTKFESYLNQKGANGNGTAQNAQGPDIDLPF